MFYKHFEKFAVALTAFFWSSCGDTISVTGGDNNSNPEYSSSSSEFRMSVPAYGVPSTSSSSELRMSSTLYGITYNCFNTTENNAEGVEFEIIECGHKSGDGILESTKKKYLRNPYDATKDTPLPDGVQVFAPTAGTTRAANCTSESDICIERNPNIPAEQDSLAGCHPIIDCPEKPN